MGIYVNTYGTSNVNKGDGEIAEIVEQLFDMRPAAIEARLKLRQPMYLETAAYGHMGRDNRTVTKKFTNVDGTEKVIDVELFTWEKLDYVDKVKIAFGL
jgi:S-adenosylmethionine synthetase